MNRTSKFAIIIVLISTVLLSACGQVAATPAVNIAPQVTLLPQASSTSLSTSPAPQSSPRPPASSTPTPPVILSQIATSVPTQPSGVSSPSYVAYASGLASNFTKGNICSLEQPFTLEGDALPVSSGLIANFTPASATQGDYTFTNNILDGECVDSSSGTYDVKFYTADEGDIIMTGDATRVCQGVTVFSGTTEFRIAIKGTQLIACP